MNLSTLFNLSFAFLSVACAVTSALDPVRDWNGSVVEAGLRYNLWGVGPDLGPITLGRGLNGSQCIRNVICRPNRSPSFVPDPVILWGANSPDPVVRVGQDYNIIFDGGKDKACHNVWKINFEVGSRNHNFITTGGQSGHPGCWNLNTWFQFKLVDDAKHLYRIVFNPQVCDKGVHCPEDIVLQQNNDGNGLYLNQRQFIEKPVELHVRFTRYTSSVLEAWE